MPTARNRKRAKSKKANEKNHIEIQAAPKLEDALDPNNTSSLAATLAMLQDLPELESPHIIPKTSSKDYTWMLHPSVEQLLHRFRDALITRFYPNASNEKAEAETAFIFNQIVPLLQRVPPVEPNESKEDREESSDKENVHKKFANNILKAIDNFVNESGEDFLNASHTKSAAYQIDFWKRVVIQQVLSCELTYHKEKGTIAAYNAWEHQSQEWADDLESQCRQFIQEKRVLEWRLKMLTAKWVSLQKMSNTKSLHEKVLIASEEFREEFKVYQQNYKKLEECNKVLTKQVMFLAAKSNDLVQERTRWIDKYNASAADYNKLVREFHTLDGVNKFLHDRYVHALSIQEGMVNEEYKKELARLKDEVSELKEHIKRISSGEEYVMAMEQCAFMQEKYQAEKELWGLEKKAWSDMTDKAIAKLNSNEEFFENIKSAIAKQKAELDKHDKAAKDDGIKKEGTSNETPKKKLIKMEPSFEALTHTLFNDEPTTLQVIAEIEEESKPTTRERNLQRIISSLQTELSLARRAWKIESGQQVELQKKLIAENTRLAQELATEKEARKQVEAQKSTLSIEGAEFDGTLIWVSNTYEQAEKKLQEELKEANEGHDELCDILEGMQKYIIELQARSRHHGDIVVIGADGTGTESLEGNLKETGEKRLVAGVTGDRAVFEFGKKKSAENVRVEGLSAETSVVESRENKIVMKGKVEGIAMKEIVEENNQKEGSQKGSDHDDH